MLGAHLEGPFLAKEYKGAMPESLLRTGDAALLRRWQAEFPGVITYSTVSPEAAMTEATRAAKLSAPHLW